MFKRLVVVSLAALILSACGRQGEPELPPQRQPPLNGQPQPDKPGGVPGAKPIFKDGKFILDPLL